MFVMKMLLKKSKYPPLFPQNCKLEWTFYSNWKQFQIFKIAKLEFKVTVHYGLWGKTPSCLFLTTGNVYYSIHLGGVTVLWSEGFVVQK